MHADLLWAANELSVIGADSLLVAGRLVEAGTPADLPPEQPSTLANLIYDSCYVRPRPYTAGADMLAERDFQMALARSGPIGGQAWDGGWQPGSACDGGSMTLLRDGVRFLAGSGDIRCSDEAGSWQVRVPTDYHNLLPGYFLVIGGDQRALTRDSVPILRFYWHLKAESAPRFLGIVRRVLDSIAVPYRVKVLKSPQAYRRADAGVLYLAGSCFPEARDALIRVHRAMEDSLRGEVPMFTKRLARGLAVAEDPGNGLSFGQDRCLLVARALWEGHCGARTNPQSKRDALEAAFSTRGIDPDTPFMSNGARDHYTWPHDHGPRRGNRRGQRGPGLVAWDGRSPSRPLLAAAVRIGRDLQDRAYWDAAKERCNWTGRATSSDEPSSRLAAPCVTALGPDLYGGVSGVALFLAELAAATGSRDFRCMASAAVGCAVDQVLAMSGSGSGLDPGLFTGVTGTLLAADRVECQEGPAGGPGSREQHNELDALWRSVLRTGSGPPLSDDLMGGRAGMITALLSIGGHRGHPESRERAITLGEELCRSVAPLTEGGVHAPDSSTPLALTGLSHGLSGMASALFGLYAETGGTTFLHRARELVSAEDTLFDEHANNWPDLRFQAQRHPGSRFAVTWCHGAPGIALARIRASRLDHTMRSQYQDKARAALQTTLKTTREWMRCDNFDASLCHGLSGLAEILLTGGSALREPRYQQAAHAAASHVAGAWDRRRSGTSCGGPNPSLMLGEAGVGYLLLRLCDPTRVPSLLLLPPDEPWVRHV
ncbi:lanthionine synthetase LanC family protein [Streptomyces roseus]|uniref:lanthionine synthetase LanC family protein n=1 Tax=Streptomyces roseus TaxID=66430 RepID=UPI0036B92AF1